MKTTTHFPGLKNLQQRRAEAESLRLTKEKATEEHHRKALMEALDSANRSASTSRTLWFGFMFLTLYLTVLTLGTTHKDILLNNRITISPLNTAIDLFVFHVGGALVYILLHSGLLVQHIMLSRKIHHYNDQQRKYQAFNSEDAQHIHAMVHSYFIAQLRTGQRLGRVLRRLLNTISMVSLWIIPALVLLFMQSSYLPTHDWRANIYMRIGVLVDLFGAFALGLYIRTPNKSIRECWSKYRGDRYGMSTAAITLTVIGVFLSNLVLTVPGVAMLMCFSVILHLACRCLFLTSIASDCAAGGPSSLLLYC